MHKDHTFPKKHIPKPNRPFKYLDATEVRSNWDTVLAASPQANSPKEKLAQLWDMYLDQLHSRGLITDLQAVSIINPYTEGTTILPIMK